MPLIMKGFAQFPFDGDTKKVLNSLGFTSVYDILDIEFTRFYQQYDPLLNGNAVAIYQQAKDFVTLADQQLRRSDGAPQRVSSVTPPLSDATTTAAVAAFDVPVAGGGATSPSDEQHPTLVPAKKAQLARYQQPLYEQLFSDDQSRFAPPGSLQSLDSPVSYLMYLLMLLYRMRHPDNSTSALQDLLASRPDLGTLLLNEDSFKRALPTSELAGEILQNALTTLTEEQDINRWLAFQPYPLSLPFDVARSRIDQTLDNASLTLGDAWSTLSATYREYSNKSAPALAWSGVNTGLQELLTQSLHNQKGAYPPFFLLLDENGQPTGEHSLALGPLWPGYDIKDLKVNAPESIDGIASTDPTQRITLSKLTFAPHSGNADTISLQSAVINGTVQDNRLYRATVLLTLTATAKTGGAMLEKRQLTVGILVGKNLRSREATLAVFSPEHKTLSTVLGTEIGSVTAAQMTIPIDMLCQATGINRQQLQEAFALGDYAPVLSPGVTWNNHASPLNSGIYGARFLWGTAASLAGDEPGSIKDEELTTTPFQLDRLQKLIRLQQISALPYDQLDSLLQNAIEAESSAQLSPGTLGVLGVYQRYSQAYKLTADQVAALFGPIPYCARTGEKSLFERLLTRGRHHSAGVSFPLVSTKAFSAQDLSLLADAFDTTVDTINLLINSYETAKVHNNIITRSLTGITALYRPLLLAKSFSLSVETLLLLIEQIAGRESLILLAQPIITSEDEKPENKKRDSIDLLITLDEAVRWMQQQTRDLNAFMAPLRGDTEKASSFIKAFTELWDALMQRQKALGENIQILKPSVLINKLQGQETATAAQALTPLISLICQQFHLEPGIAWSLLFNYATVLDSLAEKKPSSDLTPLLLATSVFSNAHIDEVALTPWRNGKLLVDTKKLSLWQQTLLLHDFIDLAQGDERLRPVLLSEAADWKAQLARGYETDAETVRKILNKGYNLSEQHQLQRIAAFSRVSSWSVTDIFWLITNKSLNQTNWKEYLAFSLRGSAQRETETSSLTTSLGEKRNRALLAAYKSQCRRLTIADEGKYWENAWAEHEPTTADVADKLLIDPEITAKVTTSRIAEATASVQAYLQSIADGRNPQCYMTEGELKNWHENDRYYAIWAANQQLRWHPDQYINPVARLKKTPPFQSFENRLSQSRLDQDSINDALSDYLTLFEEVVNLSTIGAYQDGMSSAQSTLYFLGRSPHAPFSYYYRTWGKDSSGLRLWSSWQKIHLPTTQNVLTQAPSGPEWNNYRNQQQDRDWMPVQARLLIFAGRVSFIWVETRVLTESVPVNSKDEGANTNKTHTATVAEKRYQHVISLVYQRINGDWSTPVELYQGQPCLPGVSSFLPEQGDKTSHPTEEAYTYLDPLPHLSAFVLPQEVAAKSLVSIKDVDDKPYYDQDTAIASDLLVISLSSTYSDPRQGNARSQLWLFDEDLMEHFSKPRWEQLRDQAKDVGMNITEVELKEKKPGNTLLNTLTDLVNNSYLYTPAQLTDDNKNKNKDKTKKPTGRKSDQFYFTRVLTPCIPENWLFNQRRVESRSERIFGSQLDLTLTVNPQTSAQSGLDSYQTLSTLTLTDEQWHNVPADAKLVHFLSVKGKTVRQALSAKTSTLTLSTFYPATHQDTSEARHGVVLIAKSASDIVSLQPADNAWIESGQLTVLHQSLTSLAAEIRQSVQGVQYLYLNDLDQPDPLNPQGHTIHGRVDPTLHQSTTTVAGVYSALVTGSATPSEIATATLEKPGDWMPLTFVKGEGGTGLSQWTFDIPQKRDASTAIWLVTRVDSQAITAALTKETGLSEGVSALQVQNNKLVPLTSLASIDTAHPVYLFTPITVEKSDQSFRRTCLIATQTQKPLFTKVTFTFYPVSKVQQGSRIMTLEKSGLRIISQQELEEDLKNLTQTTLFTKADWGWISPDFLTNSQPYQLNRTYRLQSSACHYLLLKVATEALDLEKTNVFSISVQPMLNMQQTPDYKVIGLNAQGKATAIALDQSEKHITVQRQSNTLALVKGGDLKKYTHLFFALPWTANAMADVANYGLRFQLDGLKNTPLHGLIRCEIPTLSDAVITSSCTPGHAIVGETVTIQADIQLGANTDQAVSVEVALNAAYQWAPGVATPAGAQINPNGILTLTLPAGQQTASLALPVRVLNAPGNIRPLATLTLSDNYSALRVMLEQPLIEREHTAAIEWDWYFGADTTALNRSPALMAITDSQLRSAVVLNTVRIAPSSSLTPISVTLNLPQGVTIDPEAAKILDALKSAKLETEWLEGINLITTFLQKSKSPTTGLLNLLEDMSLKQTVVLPLPLKISNTEKFIDSLTARVKFGPAQGDTWQERSYTLLRATDSTGTLAVSASSNQPHVIDTNVEPENKITCSFGDRVRLTLLIEAINAATVSEVTLALPTKLSWQNDAIQGTQLSSAGTLEDDPVSLTAVPEASGLKIALPLSLQRGERYQLDVTVVAIPQQTKNTDSGKVVFSVKTASHTLQANPLPMGNLYLPGSASVVPVFNDGRIIPAGTPLPIGTRFNYLISFALDARTLRLMMGKVEQNPIPGPRLKFALPKTVIIASDTGSELPTDLPLLSKELAENIRTNSSQKIANYGLHVFDKRTVFAQTVINPQSNIQGEFQVPVIVEQEGSFIPTLTVQAVNSQLGSQPLRVFNNPAYQPPGLSAYDTGRLPFTDLQFRRSGRGGFDLPLPENTPPLLANRPDEKQTLVTRCVRLNTQFGQSLVRTARYNPLAVLRAAMQDHPLPPLPTEKAPQPLVSDIANQLYFWELFYHVPALVAFKLNQDGRYEEAQEWLHYLFHPVFSGKKQLPAALWRCRLLTTTYSYVSLDQATGPVDPDVIASVRPEFYQRATFFAYVKNLLDNGDSYYRSQSRDGFKKAWQCYLKVTHLLGGGEQNSRIAAWKPLTVQTAIDTQVASGKPDSLFALPRSHLYQDLVNKLQQRLFNMRNGLTLDGSPLSLPLYDPPLDPAQLLVARARGCAASIRALALQQNLQLPVFRYSTLYARANAAVDTLIQFGNSLLSYLNLQKDMEYQSQLINQQKEMSNFVIGQQQLAVQMNQQARQSLIVSRDAAQQKLRMLDNQIEKDISDQESQALSLRSEASNLGISSSSMRATGAALDLAPNIFGFSDGGMHWGAIPLAVGEGLMAVASAKDSNALQIETREMYRRRREEWQLQRDDTEASLRQLEVQLEVDTRQQENLERQLAQSQAQIRQFEQQLSFIATRFTNQLLYQWLVGQLSSLYYQVYDIAAGLCQQTLTAWQYEVGNYSEQSSQFFKNSGWSDAQRGLLSGEHLRLGLLQLDKAYLSQTERMLEIRHTVSLKSLWLNQARGPIQKAGEEAAKTATYQKEASAKAAREKTLENLWKEVLQQQQVNTSPEMKELKVTKSDAELIIPIPVTEDLLAQRYPGHYQRQVLDVSVTLPCLIGPHEEVCAILKQKDSRFAIDKDVYMDMIQPSATNGSKILTNHRPQQAIALSSGLEDNGIVLSFSDDKYRPFEGNGVVGTWYLIIPNPNGELQKRMLASLNDIILTFHYRAKDGGQPHAEAVLSALQHAKEAKGSK